MKRKSEILVRYNGRNPLRRSDIGSESSRSSFSASKQCTEHNVWESKISMEKKRKKHKYLTQVTMESEKAEVHLESVAKRKKMTARSFKSLFKIKRSKENVPVIITEGSSPSQLEEFKNQGTEEQVHSVYSKNRDVKRIYSQCSSNTIDSGRNHFLAEDDINQETSNALFSSINLKNGKVKIQEDSAKQEHYKSHILLQQKLAVKDKDAESEIGYLIDKIQKKCEKRMNKLIQKQQQEIQEFHRIWEEKRSKLEGDHKLEVSITRSIHGEASVRMDKLKLLDGKFARKMKEHDLLKDVQLKELEVLQLALRNEEKQKEAHWLAEAEACSASEPRSVCGPQSLGSQSERDDRCFKSGTHILNTKDGVPLTRLHLEDNKPSKNVQRNYAAPSDKSVSAPAEEVNCNVPLGNSSNFISIDPRNGVGAEFSQRSILAGVDLLNEPKNLGTEEIICVDIPASGESVTGEIGPVELNKEVPPEVPETVSNEKMDCANPVESSKDTSDGGFDKRDAIGFPDDLVNKRGETDETTTGGLCLGQILEPLEQTKASSHHCALLLPQIPEDQIHGGSVSAVIEDKGAQVVGIQNISFEMAVSEHADTVRYLQTSIELQDPGPAAIESRSTSQAEVATLEIINTVTPQVSNEKQDQNALVVEDQVTLKIEVANLELVDTVNPVQDQVAQVVEELHTYPSEVAASDHFDTLTKLNSNIDFQCRDVPVTESQIASQTEVATWEIIDAVRPEESSEKLQYRNAPAVEDQVNLETEVANSELVDTVNPVQDQGAQVAEKKNTSPFEVASSGHADTVSMSHSNIELQDQDMPVVPSQITSQLEVATSEIIHTVTPEESREKFQDRDAPVVENQVALQIEVFKSELFDTINHVQSNADARPIENCEELHLMSIDVSPSCSEPPSIEVDSQRHNLGRNSRQTAEIAETEVLSRESASQLGENRELRTNHLDRGSECQVAQERSVEMSASSQNNVAVSQMAVSTVEHPYEAAPQLGISVGHLYGSRYPFSHPNHQVASRNSPPLFAAPLQNELERICKETEQLQKSHEDIMLQLKSDHEKEIQEIIAQVHDKYEFKLQDAEAEFSFKKNVLDKNWNKVLMNKLLAEACSYSCSNMWSLGPPGMQQGTPSSSTQHLLQLPLQHLVRSPGAIACLPAHSQQIARPHLQTLQQLLLPQYTRHCAVACKDFSASPAQAAPHAVALPFGTNAGPPVISAISPTGNLCFEGEIHSQAPHLQFPRPGASSSMPTTTLPSISQHLQQLLPSQPLQSSPPAFRPLAAPQQPLTSQSRHQHHVEPPALFSPSLSTLELLIDADHQPHIPGNHISSLSPETRLALGSLEQSYLDTLGDVEASQTLSAATNVVCLSDDD